MQAGATGLSTWAREQDETRDSLRPALAVVPLGPGRGRARAGYRQRAPEQPELPIDLRYRLRPYLPGRRLPGTHTRPGHYGNYGVQGPERPYGGEIYDRRGRSVTYRDLVRGTSVNIRFR